MTDDGRLFTPAAYAQEAQEMASKLLRPRVEELFSQRFGSNWAPRLLEKMKIDDAEKKKRDINFRGRILPAIKNGKIEWDFSQLVYTIIDNVDDFQELHKNRTEIVNICYKLRDGRNLLAHGNASFDRNDVKFAKAHIERLVSLCRLVLSKSGDEERISKFLHALVNVGQEVANKPTPADHKGVAGASVSPPTNDGDLQQIRGMLEVVLQKLEQQPKEAGTSASAPVLASPPRAAVREASAAIPPPVRRRTQIPGPRPGLCLFPIVAEGDGATDVGELGYVNTNTYQPEGRQSDLSRVTGFSGVGRSDVYYQVIQDSRFGEDDPAKANLHTHARIDPGDFIGSSFGLAAALADRSARYGWAPELRDRVIIATGIIGKGGRGQVEPIGSFVEKLEFLERHTPLGSLFLFPAGNVEQASREIHALLARITAAGRLTLRPVRHLSELGDLFPSSDRPMGQAASGVNASAGNADAKQPVASPREQERAIPGAPYPTREQQSDTGQKEHRPQPHRHTRILFSIALAGLALLAGAYVIAERSESGRASPEQMQKISDFLGAYDGMDPAALTAAQCRTLTAARQALTEEDITKLGAPAARAIAAAQTCAQRLAESKKRIARLVGATKLLESNGPTPASCSALDIAVAGLQPFDGNTPDTGVASRISYIEPCKAVLAESDRRIRVADRLVEVVTRNSSDLAACRDLASAFEQLTNEDMERVAVRDAAIRERALECSARIADSEARLRAVRDAASAFESADPSSARALLSARSRLTPADISQLSPQQSATLQSAVDGARALVGASDARIRNVLTSYAAWQSSSTYQNAARFAQAGDQLTDADRNQQAAGDIQGALSALARVKDAMAARAQRWSLVERLTNVAEGQSPADYWSKLDDAVGRLSASDKEAMTSEQAQILRRAQRLLSLAKPRENEFGTISGR